LTWSHGSENAKHFLCRVAPACGKRQAPIQVTYFNLYPQ